MTKRRRRVKLGSTPEEHTKLANDARERAVSLLDWARASVRKGHCETAISQLAQAERQAGMAWADARSHTDSLDRFSRVLLRAEDVRRDVMANCRRR